MKFKKGSITNPKTNEVKDIVVSCVNGNSVKQTVIGAGIILVGVTYLTTSAFNNGTTAMELAEYKALKDLGLTS